MTNRYARSVDENAFFQKGAVSWRLDPLSSRVLVDVLGRVEWHSWPDDAFAQKVFSKAPAGTFVSNSPFGSMSDDDKKLVLSTVNESLNDRVLFPILSRRGVFEAVSVEVQNGALDWSWHQDALSKPQGHNGDHFLLLYFGEPSWEPEWGGAFAYGERDLQGEWDVEVSPPQGDVSRVFPVHRTAILGWNENPRLIHRSEPLLAQKDRKMFILPVRHRARF